MKKFLFISLLVLSSTIVNAKNNKDIILGKNPKQVTVKQALEMKDDSIVIVNGKIIESLGDEEYIFQDNTGKIQIEIDDDFFNFVKINPQNDVIIEGEIDENWFSPNELEATGIKQK